MKAQLKKTDNTGFKPITIEITIEDRETFYEFYFRNTSCKHSFTGEAKKNVTNNRTDLDDLLFHIKRGLRG